MEIDFEGLARAARLTGYVRGLKRALQIMEDHGLDYRHAGPASQARSAILDALLDCTEDDASREHGVAKLPPLPTEVA